MTSDTARIRPHVARALEQTKAVLLGFSTLFELIDPTLAREITGVIRDRILARGHQMSPLTVLIDDPLTMLIHARRLGPDEAADAEQILRSAELTAAATTTIIPDARLVLDACQASGRKVAVLSVHCTEAVEAALERSGLRHAVGPAIGREHITTWDHRWLGELIGVAVREPAWQPASCAMIGLTWEAMSAARSAGVQGIGVVNKHTSRKHLAAPGLPVVSSLPALAASLTAVTPSG